MDRREFLQTATITSLAFLIPGCRGWAFSNGKESSSGKRLIVILLRGAVDGLSVVAPYGDPLYHQMRPTIALPKPGSELGAINLDGYFGLHPALAPLMPLWQGRTLAFVHASGSPDPSRSHFDAQDYMESGIPGNKAVSTGWLNRLLSELPQGRSALQAISLGPVLPRIFRGPATVATISKAVQANKTVLDRPIIASAFHDLYSDRSDDLGRAFAEGMGAHMEVNSALKPDNVSAMEREQIIANKGAPTPGHYARFGEQLARLFKKSPSIQLAFVDFGGWDTHVSQGAGKGQLANHLAPLSKGLADLTSGLGSVYQETTIMVMSEFGRTARENGNSGTDHGHGNAMWVMGGGIPGGNVYGRWAGLSLNSLYERRDLPATTDFRSVIATVLANNLEVSRASIAKVFPDFQPDLSPFVRA